MNNDEGVATDVENVKRMTEIIAVTEIWITWTKAKRKPS